MEENENTKIKSLGLILEHWHNKVGGEVYRGMYYKMAEISELYLSGKKKFTHVYQRMIKKNMILNHFLRMPPRNKLD